MSFLSYVFVAFASAEAEDSSIVANEAYAFAGVGRSAAEGAGFNSKMQNFMLAFFLNVCNWRSRRLFRTPSEILGNQKKREANLLAKIELFIPHCVCW
jgi:hypothetical protein